MTDNHLLSPTELDSRLELWAAQAQSYPFFEGDPDELGTDNSRLNKWLEDIEMDAAKYGIGREQWADAALFFFRGEVREVMMERKGRYLVERAAGGEGEGYWDWDDFRKDVTNLIDDTRKIMASESMSSAAAAGGSGGNVSVLDELRRKHPYIVASAGTGLVIGGSVVLLPALGLVALNAVGFSAGGIAAGSLAAGLQSVFYGAATGGLFSMCQAFAATTAAATTGSLFVASTAVTAGFASLFGRANQSQEEDVQE